MIEPDESNRRAVSWVAVWVTAVLAVSAALGVGYRITLAVGLEDTDVVESTLVLPVARQLTHGPASLYGPFNGRNPHVLIHAPLYYRLSAALAWPLHRAGLAPVTAALAAGRGLSFLALLVLLGLADRLARLDGATGRGGLWAALLVASTPIMGLLPVTLRPDMVAVGFETAGLLLALSALGSERPGTAKVVAAYVAFGLAVCVKQHLVVAPAVCTVLLVTARLRGRIASKPIERGLLLGLVVVLAVYGADELLTRGRMSQCVFGVARSVSRVRPADIDRAFGIVLEISNWCAGLTFLLFAAGLALAAAGHGRGRRRFATAGAVVLTAAMVAFFVGGRSAWYELPDLLAMFVAAPLFLFACTLAVPRKSLGGRVDAALWACWAGEFVVTAYLCKSSTGSWTNYALQGVVYACVLTARALVRAFEGAASPLPLLPAALASLVVLHLVVVDVTDDRNRRRRERENVHLVLERMGADPKDVFFVNKPGLNRLSGRTDLVYDEWLYPIFEAVGQAERRSIWLRAALISGEVRHVVTGNVQPKVDGLNETLPEMRFLPTVRAGRFFVWQRAGAAVKPIPVPAPGSP